MDYLDTWVWVEYGLDGPHADTAEHVIESIGDGAVTSTIALLETGYILTREIDQRAADYVTSAIEDLQNVHVVPVTAEIALYAAELRTRYYDRQDRQLSYADAIHLSTAILTDCTTLQTGDADFEGVTEIDAVVHPTT